ncbi:tRNA (adenosine(37)-N6)-dimethylallyltransferase MiaA [Cyanobacterium sp. Dongsha4]|uniref:tRNA (adenosine(37)-N6)-dimethylallyltransferase MiaA n=1 Tax=Cyanobacterium sp. DS4 TaxID=2878255 RepID=UPI002E81777B|nr:tRNA (adenosine(37)-N6)-dimethylallyltransferase MiaA [Cyanobacterium sp. Dongsha4]WVL02418.1 tRNA (adenosine(37)-N6)-dimethylallyltransferase MiaA [Cyanobacterium sp. Dongsha4]
MDQKLIVICGATASGKSALALEIAQKLDTLIISADSRQIYHDFDIGTAKPSSLEQKLVSHYLIDICHPQEVLTVAQYQSYAQDIIKKSSSIPLMVGGTGLYIKSVTRGLKIPPVAPQAKLRSQLETYSQQERYAFLQKIDPTSCKKIHPNDDTRTIRALEVYYVTGKTISAQQGENPPSYPILHLGLYCEREFLRQRIATRTKKMLEMGLVEETEFLISKYGIDLPLLNTLGYAEIKQYLQGEISLSEAQDLIVTHTCQFAKRQQTWFNGYPEIVWLDVSSSQLVTNAWEKIDPFIHKKY